MGSSDIFNRKALLPKRDGATAETDPSKEPEIRHRKRRHETSAPPSNDVPESEAFLSPLSSRPTQRPEPPSRSDRHQRVRVSADNRAIEEVFERPTMVPSLPPEEHARVLMHQLDLQEETAMDAASRATQMPSDEPPELDIELELIDETPIPLERVSETSDAALSLPPAPSDEAAGALEFVERQSERPSRAATPDPDARSSPRQMKEALSDVSASSTSMSDLYAVGDFSGALAEANRRLRKDRGDAIAGRYKQRCEEVLGKMWSSRLGSLSRHARVLVPPDQIRWLSVDHRAGFMLSLIDERLSLEEVLDISGMPRLDALGILVELLERRVIEVNG